MKILNNEQLAYLKSLESPKKRRKFMLDCLVENALGESEKSVKISELPFYFPFKTSTAPETLKAIDYGKFENSENLSHNWYKKQLDDYDKKQREAQEVFYEKMKCIISENDQSTKKEMFNEEEFLKQTNSFKIVDCDGNTFYRKKFEYLDEKSTKPNYSSEEIEIAKSLNSEREEKKWTDEDMIRAFEKGNHATCNAFLVIPFHKAQTQNYLKQKDEFIKSLKNK